MQSYAKKARPMPYVEPKLRIDTSVIEVNPLHGDCAGPNQHFNFNAVWKWLDNNRILVWYTEVYDDAIMRLYVVSFTNDDDDDSYSIQVLKHQITGERDEYDVFIVDNTWIVSCRPDPTPDEVFIWDKTTLKRVVDLDEITNTIFPKINSTNRNGVGISELLYIEAYNVYEIDSEYSLRNIGGNLHVYGPNSDEEDDDHHEIKDLTDVLQSALGIFDPEDQQNYIIAHSPVSNVMAICIEYEHNIHLFSLPRFQQICTLDGDAGPSHLCFSSDGLSLLAAGDCTASVMIWDA
jgi:WD40 repeat protein